MIALGFRSSMVALLLLVGCGDQERDRRVAPGAGSPQGPSPVGAAKPRTILERIPELDDLAARAVTGQLGCDGFAETTLVTSRGIRTSTKVSDGRRVFGLTIKTSELIELLKARCTSLRTGQGPMAGQKSSLCFVILDALAHSADPEAIPVIAELLQDPEESISSWSAITLFTIGNEDDELRPAIGTLRFPRKAAGGAAARGFIIPGWVPPGAIRD